MSERAKEVPAPVGIVAFSFGLRSPELEPNPSNVDLAEAVRLALRSVNGDSVVVAQWEVARALRDEGVAVDVVVLPEHDGSYLDSATVWRAADDAFRRAGVSTVMPIAHRLLHRRSVSHLIRRSGYELGRFAMPRVRFDRSRANTQWWTRGPLRLSLYAVLQAAGFHKGRSTGGRTIASPAGRF